MEEIKAGKILNGIVALKGYAPLSYTLSAGEREKWADGVNDALREAMAEAKFPQMVRTELRQFRPDWDEEQGYLEGHEVLHGGKYWKALADCAGVEPGTDDEVWEVPEDGIHRFIELEQPWEGVRMDEAGVDLNAFAWEVDPRLRPGSVPLRGCEFWMGSVVVPETEGVRVWVRFIPKRERFDFTEWSAAAAYEAGDVRFRTLTGDCYRALSDMDAGGAVPESNEEWLRIRVPEFLAKFVKLSVYATELSEESGRFRAVAAAEAELQRVVDTVMDGAGVDQVSFSGGR